MKFIVDRSNGKSFKDATGFVVIENALKGEREIKRFQKKIKQFGYIK